MEILRNVNNGRTKNSVANRLVFLANTRKRYIRLGVQQMIDMREVIATIRVIFPRSLALLTADATADEFTATII